MTPSDNQASERPNWLMVCRAHGRLMCDYCNVSYDVFERDERRLQNSQWVQITSRSYTSNYGTREGETSQTDTRSRFRDTLPVSQGYHSPDPPLEAASDPQFDDAEIRQGYERILPTAFIPPAGSTEPDDLFQAKFHLCLSCAEPSYHWVRQDDPKQMLIYTDGACSNNGQLGPQAGWAFVVGPPSFGITGHVSGRLEDKGPIGDEYRQTSNRAELRAVVEALRYRNWAAEGFTSVVIATDSAHVAKGVTRWIRKWLKNGWRASDGPVKNKDMWAMLLEELERCDSLGFEVKLWRIPRKLNRMADEVAKSAAEKDEVRYSYQDIRRTHV
ncbi:ribonuclease H domain-containing protein [Pochonia chlamydosporia 170]|uniref:ribonuclease H n=1 Tax=Pochonia chlamydosporia 170 TaxID=1380566 RepID=A0A179F5R5_METCM|nr:ribonuclease H domain-containing protein [Pochonia chlamydosporia 170]OAQ60459.1 ribonuclease H domain-containing protein [Pochonia chlamydosporia 170]